MKSIAEQKLEALESFAKATPKENLVGAAGYMIEQAKLLMAEYVASQEQELLNRLNMLILKLQKFLEPAPENRQFLSVAAIMKDEGPYLDEWIEYHLLVGVEKFYLYDNESTDDTQSVLAPYIEEGIVEYIPWGGHGQQLNTYAHCIIFHGKATEWLALIDIDEFIAPLAGGSVADFLRTLPPDAGQLLADWCCFNSGGHLTKPKGLVIENYKMRTAGHNHVKSIVRSEAVNTFNICFPNPHFLVELPGATVDENGNQIPDNVLHITGEHRIPEKIAIFHYVMKSREEFLARRSRLTADGGAPFYNGVMTVAEAFEKQDRGEVLIQLPPPYDHQPDIHYDVCDTVMEKYIEPVKEALARRGCGFEQR